MKKTKIVILSSAVLLLGACASVPDAPDALKSAESALEVAKDSGYGQVAPLELKLAQEKITAAYNAVQDKDVEKARRLAEQAKLDIELAETKTQSEKVLQSTNELKESIATLESELQRSRIQ